MSLQIDTVFPHPPQSIFNHLQNPRLKTMWCMAGMPVPPVLNTVYSFELLLLDKAFDKILLGAFLSLIAPVNLNLSPTGVNFNFSFDTAAGINIGNVFYPAGADPNIGLSVVGPMWGFLYGNIAGSEVFPAFNSVVPAFVQNVPAITINIPAGVPPAAGTWVTDAFQLPNGGYTIANATHTTVKNANKVGSYKAMMCEVITKNRTLYLNTTFQAAFISANQLVLACALIYWTGTWVA